MKTSLKLHKGIHYLINANKVRTVENKSFLQWFLDCKKDSPHLGIEQLEKIAYFLNC